MNAQEIIARRVALELREGMLVNLGIGLPTMVANHIPRRTQCIFAIRKWFDWFGCETSRGYGG